MQSIQLEGWDFPVADGHVVSAVWAVREGASSGTYLHLRNHTTGICKSGMSFLAEHLLRVGSFPTLVLEVLLCVGLAVLAAPVVGGFVVAIAAALGGGVVGSLAWHLVVKSRFLTRFRREGLPRINTALDGLAATPAAS